MVVLRAFCSEILIRVLILIMIGLNENEVKDSRQMP